MSLTCPAYLPDTILSPPCLVGEYKYQIGCQVDYDPNNPETPMFIMELERVVRNLPQTITGETPKAMPTRTKVHYTHTWIQDVDAGIRVFHSPCAC